jgi:hypothetical protein
VRIPNGLPAEKDDALGLVNVASEGVEKQIKAFALPDVVK